MRNTSEIHAESGGQMDERRAKIQEDIRGLIEGEIRCDDVFLQLYASDASIYQIPPLGVVRPRSDADVVACVQYASEKQIPLHARGAGTGLAGESLGPGLVLDFSKSMRRILTVKGDRVRVQAGATLLEVNRRLASVGRRFVVDPANGSVTTMGSVVAVNPAGSRSIRYGQAGDYVESLKIVTATGETLEVGREPLPGTPNEPSPGVLRDLVAQTADVLRRYADPIEARRPKARFNRSGYQLWDLLGPNTLNVARLLTGSEGTLALVTEAEFRTVPLPSDRVTALFFFDRLDAAARAALEVRELNPTASDLLDRRLLTLARDADARYDLLIPPTAEAALLTEFEGGAPGEARAQAERVKDLLRARRVWAFDDAIAESDEEMELYWQLSRLVTPTLNRLKGAARPLPFVEDVAVPPETLPTFLVAVQNILKRHHTTASLFAHAGHGQLHMRPFLDLRRPEDV
ncbi:MAG TPA: FAD-binding oxidoreductase, partial [Pirellulales bacterium]